MDESRKREGKYRYSRVCVCLSSRIDLWSKKTSKAVHRSVPSVRHKSLQLYVQRCGGDDDGVVVLCRCWLANERTSEEREREREGRRDERSAKIEATLNPRLRGETLARLGGWGTLWNIPVNERENRRGKETNKREQLKLGGVGDISLGQGSEGAYVSCVIVLLAPGAQPNPPTPLSHLPAPRLCQKENRILHQRSHNHNRE